MICFCSMLLSGDFIQQYVVGYAGGTVWKNKEWPQEG